MECRAYLYWESEIGNSYQFDTQIWLPGLNHLGQEYTLYGYEENLCCARSNRFVVCSIESKHILAQHEERHVRLVEKISYVEQITFFPHVEESKKKG